MEWQDIVIATASVILASALLPTIFSEKKPAWQTAVMTSATLYVMAFTYSTLGLTFATITTAISASLWATIFIQVMLRKKR